MHATLRVEVRCHTPWAHCADGPRRTAPLRPSPRATRRRIVARGPRSWRCCAATGGRPRFDPGLAGGLRAWLEDAAYDVVAARGEHAPPLFLGPRQLLGSHESSRWRWGGDGDGAAGSSSPGWCTRCSANWSRRRDRRPLARRARRTAGRTARRPTRGRSRRSRRKARTALAETLALHARNLTGLVSRFAPGWMPGPTTGSPSRSPGGRIVLHGVFDLVVGLPQPRHGVALRARTVHPGQGRGATVAALPLVARNPAERHSPVPAGVAGIRVRPLRRRGRARGAPPGARLAHRRVARPGRHRTDASCRRGMPRMDSRLMDALVAPVPAVDATSWRAALDEASRSWPAWPCGAPGPPLPGHRPRGAHRIRHGAPAIRSGRALRLVGPHGAAIHRVAAVRLLLAGATRSPLEAVRCRMAESSRWVQEGRSSATQLDRWVAGLPPAGRAAVGAEAVTWATRLWWASTGRRSRRCRSSAGTTGGTAPIRRSWRSTGAPTCARRGRTSWCCPARAVARSAPSSHW